MHIFVDGSYSPQKKIGVGAYIIIDLEKLNSLEMMPISDLKNILKNEIVYCVFEQPKGSTDVEQKILDLASNTVLLKKCLLTVYTDCQKTQTNDDYKVIHVKGHTKQKNRIGYEKIFDVIDKASRKRLRDILKTL